MKDETLQLLCSRINDNSLTKEQKQSKVCQDIFMAKIGANERLSHKIVFKGGVIINALSFGMRGFTKDIDFDLIKYPLTENGIKSLIEQINYSEPYQNIVIRIKNIKSLNHKNYKGKRAELSFTDGKDIFSLLVDIGVFKPLIKKNVFIKYDLIFSNSITVLTNPIERIVAEKLSTFAIFGLDNTRNKDFFDASYLINAYSIDKCTVLRILSKLLVDDYHYFQNIDLALDTIKEVLENKEYELDLIKSEKNWNHINVANSTKELIDFIESL